MQQIVDVRDKLRADIEQLDGGYTTVAKILKKSTVFVSRTLKPDNMPRLSTLEDIKDAYDTAKKKQDTRLQRLSM